MTRAERKARAIEIARSEAASRGYSWIDGDVRAYALPWGYEVLGRASKRDGQIRIRIDRSLTRVVSVATPTRRG